MIPHLSRRWLMAVLLLVTVSVSSSAGLAASQPPAEKQEMGPLDRGLQRINDVVAGALFFNVAGDTFSAGEFDKHGKPVLDPETGEQKQRIVEIPFLIVLLLAGAVFFTFWYRFINVRGFRHAIDVVRGKYDDPADTGEITHFRALT